MSTTDVIVLCVLFIWAFVFVIQFFLGFGTAYRCTKKGNDNGTGLFIYLIGFSFAALVPGLGLHYYIKHLQPKIIIQRQTPPQQNVIRVIDTAQMRQQEEEYQRRLDMQAYQQQRAQMQSSVQKTDESHK